MTEPQLVTFFYRNWRNEVQQYVVEIGDLDYGLHPIYQADGTTRVPEPGEERWVLQAYKIDGEERKPRTFSLERMLSPMRPYYGEPE
jgi:hypothetical protein